MPDEIQIPPGLLRRTRAVARKADRFGRSVLRLCERLEEIARKAPEVSRSGRSAAGYAGSAASMLEPDANAIVTHAAQMMAARTPGEACNASWQISRILPEGHPLQPELERVGTQLATWKPKPPAGPTPS